MVTALDGGKCTFVFDTSLWLKEACNSSAFQRLNVNHVPLSSVATISSLERRAWVFKERLDTSVMSWFGLGRMGLPLGLRPAKR